MSRERERYDEIIGKKIKREKRRDASVYDPQMGIIGSNVMGTTSSNLLNTITPCAACKLLRRRCAEDCPFVPYFSPLEPYRFAAVHRVFGASNVCKMLMEVPESQRAAAANSLVYEANVRLGDPVHGCMGAISILQQQVRLLQAELDAVRAEISRYRYREAANDNNSIVYNFGASTTHLAPSLIISTEAAVPAAMVPPPALPSPPPLPPPPPPPSVKVSSSLYTSLAISEILVYNPIPSNSVPYLD